ncbi:MAG: hypothetical protein ACOYEG_11925 [Petrimonas sp.]|jgi:hypothetical protein
MTKKDLLRIILKITGLYFLITIVFFQIPSFLVFIKTIPVISLLVAFVVLLIIAAIFTALIFKPDFVINLLKLDKGFDDDVFITPRVSLSNLIKISIIIIGLFLIVKHLPQFITHLFFLFKLLVKNQNGISGMAENQILTDYVSWGIKILSLIIGYLMITNYSAIARFILKKDSEKQSDK